MIACITAICLIFFVEDRPGTSMSGVSRRGEINHSISLTDEEDSDTTSTNQGAYDVLRRVSIADTHL